MQADDSTRRSGQWARIEERGVYLGLLLTLTVYRLFGRVAFSIVLYPVITYFFLSSGAARRASRSFLARVYADPQGRETLGRRPGWRQSFHHFLCFGEAILDKLAAWMGDLRADNITYENRAAVSELLDAGQGCVLIGSHLGNIEVCRALSSLYHDIKIVALVHTKHSENFNRLMRRTNPRSNVSLIETTEIGPDTALMLRERVARGELVVIVGDRTPVSHSLRYSWTPFLGRPAPFPHGPFVLAALMKCPALLIFCLKRDGHHHMVFEPFADSVDLPRRNRAEALDNLIARYAARLEHYCVRFPYQWFNLFDFWSQADAISSRSDPGESPQC